MLTTSGHTHLHLHTWANRTVSIVLPGQLMAGGSACFLISLSTTGPRGGGIAHSELAPLHPVINQENAPPHTHTNLPTGPSDGGNFSVDGSSSQITLACAKLTETNLHMILALLQVVVSLHR